MVFILVFKTICIRLLSACAIERFSESLDFNSKCVSLNKQPCKGRPTTVNIGSHKTVFYPLTFSVNKCDGSCNTVDDLYNRVCIPNKVKAFNLISGVNETRFIVQHESCECKCGLNKSACNAKQK